MQQPLDYPIEEPAEHEAVPASADDDAMTYAALLDRYESEEPITDAMIHHACRKMDAAQQFPFAGGDEGSALSIRKLFRAGG